MFRVSLTTRLVVACVLFIITPREALSQDCNGNGIQDAIEQDCNGNGSPDDCDIAAGHSFDFNGNGLPDSCERSAPNVIFVHQNATPGGNGTTWGSAFNNLQSALSAATAGKQIWVSKGTYKPTTGTDRTIYFSMKEGVHLFAGFAGGELILEDRNVQANETILSGDLLGDDGPGFTNRTDNTHHVVYCLNVGNWALDGFTITAGHSQVPAQEFGGGIYINGGGQSGIYIRNCLVIDNWGKRNGGLDLGNVRAPVVVENCRFLGNRCEPAGGASGGGGAVSVGNVFEGVATFRQCAFSGNTSNTGGGAIYVVDTIRVESCTFSRNHADAYGGAIMNNSTVVDLVNSIFWDNSSGQLSGFRGELMGFSETYNLHHVCIQDWNGGSPYQGTAVTAANPLFVDGDGADNVPGTRDDDLRLSAISASVDGGDNAALTSMLTRDLANFVRIADGNADNLAKVDLGAYEFGAEIQPDCNNNGIADASDLFGGSSLDLFPVGGNGIPDECDLDCNLNGTPDTDDIAGGSSSDCNLNGIPDECESDCNNNGTPDECDMAQGFSRDCVADGIPDECGQDCNLNCIADSVDIAPGFVTSTSPQITPFNDGSTPRFHTFASLPPAVSDVTLTFQTYRDLVNLQQVSVQLNSTPIGNIFMNNGLPAGCRTATAQLVLTAGQFNSLVNGGDATFRMQPLAGAWAICGGTYITVTTSYNIASTSTDCDANSVPDECHSAYTDIATFSDAVIAGSQSPADVCMFDTNGDGVLDGLDVAGFLARVLGV